jgi:hypothetical protein
MKFVVYLLLYFAFGLVTNQVYAQQFTLTDGNKAEVFYGGQQHISSLLRFQNLTDGDLLLAWETVDFSIPANQTYNVCDNVHCFLEIPPIGQVITMDTIRKNEYGFLKPELRNWNCQNKTSTRMVFDVYPTGMKSEAQRVTFLFHCYPNGISDFFSENLIISPNPFNEKLTVDAANGNIKSLQLLNILGQEVRTSNTSYLQTSDLPAGVYSLKINLLNEKIVIRKVVKQ